MQRCNHTDWLSLSTQSNETALLESDRLQELLENIPNVESQFPTLFVLIGNVAKSLALQELIAVRNVRRSPGRRRHGEIHLWLDPSSNFQNRPLLFADGDLCTKVLRSKAVLTPTCHEIIRHIFPRPRRGIPGLPLDEVADNLYSCLLHPFADVFCLFSADIGGFRPAACHIARWLEKGRASTLPKGTYPRLIIVIESIAPTVEKEREAKDNLLRLLSQETTKSASECFSEVDVVALFPESKMSNHARHRRLKEYLMNVSDKVRIAREEKRVLFFARHFNAFFRQACKHFVTSFEEPFDFIRVARQWNPVAKDLGQHLSNFLKFVRSPHDLINFAVPVIASSFSLDSYPPDAHMFEPSSVFETLYKYICREAGREATLIHKDILLPSGFVNMIQEQMQQYFHDATQSMATKATAEIHRQVLKRFKTQWNKIRSRALCLVCLRRIPQHELPCGHCICENCVIIFGQNSLQDPWLFNINECFLCELPTPNTTIRVHQPTTGVGVLCIDGGGVRGILPLLFLKLLQERINLPIPVQRFFKAVFGVSSGGIVALGLCKNGWSIDYCIDVFVKLAKVAFKRRKVVNIPIISDIQTVLTCFLADCLYPADNIESALKSAFGSDTGILDTSADSSMGTHIGLPVSTVRKPSLCLFTNYNGIGERDRDCGYHILRPDVKVPVWEIARSASAAPGFFNTKDIEGVGTFQDAGTIQNNPISTALSEVEAIFPLCEEPDFVISLGTGGPRSDAASLDTSGHRGIVKDGFIPRSFRAFWETTRGERAWKTLTGSGWTKSSGKFHRLDIEFNGPEPRLDDAESIPDLLCRVLEDPSIPKVIDNVARCVVASLFYFELDSIPKHIKENYIGTGRIQCVLRQGDPAFRALFDQLSRASAAFYIEGHQLPGFIDDKSSFDHNGNFQKRVNLAVPAKFSICLQEGNSEPCNISRSPFTIKRSISARGLDAHFGRADHRKRERQSESDLPAKRRRIVRGL